MAIRRDKVIRAAEKYVQKGKVEAAIKQYRKVLKEAPDDINTLNRVGDLYARTSQIDEAVRLFTQIAERYTEDGFLVKAIAIYKKIIKLDPTHLLVYERLADLYHRQGLKNEARTQYQVLADYYLKHDDSASAINIHLRMIELEPENPSHHLKLAELYRAESLWDKAMGEYSVIAEMMLSHGSVEEASQVYQRAIEVNANDLDFITEAVYKLKESGHMGAAARLLSIAVAKNPEASAVADRVGMGPQPETIEEPVGSTLETEGVEEKVSDPVLEVEFHESGVVQAVDLGMTVEAEPVTGTFRQEEELEEIELGDLSDDFDEFELDLDEDDEFELDFPDDGPPATLVAPPDDMDQTDHGSAFKTDSIISMGDLSEPESDENLVSEPDLVQTSAVDISGLGPAGQSATDIEDPLGDDLDLSGSFELDLDDMPSLEEMEGGQDLDLAAEAIEIVQDPDQAAEVIEAQEDLPEEVLGPLDLDDPLSDDLGLSLEAPQEIEWSFSAEPVDEGLEAAEDIAMGSRPSSSGDFSLGSLEESGEEAINTGDETVGVFPEEEFLPLEVDLVDLGVDDEAPTLELPTLKTLEEELVEDEVEMTQPIATAPPLPKAVPAPPKAIPPAPPKVIPAPPKAGPAPSKPSFSISAEEPSESTPTAPPMEPVKPQAKKVPTTQDLLAEAEVFANYGLEEKALDRLRDVLTKQPQNIDALCLSAVLNAKAKHLDRAVRLVETLRGLIQEGRPKRWVKFCKRMKKVGFTVSDSGLETAAPAQSTDRISQLLHSLVDDVPRKKAKPRGKSEISKALDKELEQLKGLVHTGKSVPRPASKVPVEPILEESVAEEPIPVVEEAPVVSAESSGETEVPEVAVPEMEPSLDEELPHIELPMELSTSELAALDAIGAPKPEVSVPEVDEDEDSALSWLQETKIKAPGEMAAFEEEDLFDDEEGFFDLAAELEEELGDSEIPGDDYLKQPEEPSLEEIVEGFKKGVAENLSEEDYDTHYNLGIAYREMGLIDEAIGEFQLASKSNDHLVDCCSMLGVCFLEKGLPELGIKWYQKGLEAPGVSDDATLGMLYDMGNVYLSMGDEEAALKTFSELYGINSGYRDVIAKIEELRR